MSQNVSVSRSYLLLFSEFTSAKIQHFPVFPTHSPQKIAASAQKGAEPSPTLRLAIQSLNPVMKEGLIVFCAASGTRTRTAAIAKGF